jgi:DNA polymerase III epsilon subunit family exonuclease
MGERRFVICDIEATGLDEDKEPIEIALITYEDGKVLDVYQTHINPLKHVSSFIHDLTLISRRTLLEAPKFYDVAEAIRVRLEGNTFVSHHTEFDLGLLKKKFKELGQELKVKDFCTLKVAQEEIPGLRNYNLDKLCNFFNIKIHNRHTALGDAEATLELFKELSQLRHRFYPKVMFLPHHEKQLRELPARPGLLLLKDAVGRVLQAEATFDLRKDAKKLLEVRFENKKRLGEVEQISYESTGSALIAEFRKLLLRPIHMRFCVALKDDHFIIVPYRKGVEGIWYYPDLAGAKKKLSEIKEKLRGETFAYRDSGRPTKEEITRQRLKAQSLSKDGRFPADNILILGEGRTLNEKSLILIRKQHVVGHGYSTENEDTLHENPEAYITQRYSKNLGVDLAALRHLRILKNLRDKKDGWRSLADRARVRNHGPKEV